MTERKNEPDWSAIQPISHNTQGWAAFYLHAAAAEDALANVKVFNPNDRRFVVISERPSEPK